MKGKKLLAVILAALMTVSSTGLVAFAESETPDTAEPVQTEALAETTVYEVGTDKEYSSLNDAFTELNGKTGDVTIKLFGTTEYSYGARTEIGHNGKITIEGESENTTILNLKGTDTDWSSIGNANGTIVFKNMTINKTEGGNGAWNNHAINFTSNVEMESVTVNNSVAVGADASFKDVDFVENGEYYTLWIKNNVENVTVDGCTFTATEENGRGIKIADQYVDEADQIKTNLTVKNSTFKTAKKAAILVTSKKGADITADKNDITGVNADSTSLVWLDSDCADYVETVKVYDENGNIAESALKVEDGAVVTYAAKVGNIPYTSLANAVAAAEDGDTVALIADCEIGQVNIAKNVTLDLDGKTVEGTFMIDTAAVDVTIKNGTIDSTADTEHSSVEVANGAKLTLTDVNTQSARHAVRVDGADATIDGGDYKLVFADHNATRHVVNVSGNSNVIIKAGTFTALAGAEGFNESTGAVNVRDDGAKVTIEGGTFSKGVQGVIRTSGTGSLIVKGGSFDEDVTEYVPAGYAVTGADGSFSVAKRERGLASITRDGETMYYTSLQEAADNAVSGDTIFLNEDIVITKAQIEANTRLVRITNGSGGYAPNLGAGTSITFDLGGHTISFAEDVKDTTCEDYRLFNVWYTDCTIKNGTWDILSDTNKGICSAITVYYDAVLHLDVDVKINTQNQIVFSNGKKVYIDGGTYTLNNTKYNNYPYVGQEWSKLLINTSVNSPFIFNGGTFVNFDPLCQSKPAWYTTSGVGEGKAMTKNGGTFTVVDADDMVATITRTVVVYKDWGAHATKERVYSYTSLADAIANAEDGDTITLTKNANGDGIVFEQGEFNQNGITIDLGGYTYTVDGDLVGSSGTETNGFQLLKDNNITIKNGTIKSEKAKLLIQNYSDLTLESVTLDGSKLAGTTPYTLSNNNGDVTIKDSTVIGHKNGYAFDVCDYSNYAGATVTVEDSTINGYVQIDNNNGGEMNSKLVSGTNEYTENGDYVQMGSSFVTAEKRSIEVLAGKETAVMGDEVIISVKIKGNNLANAVYDLSYDDTKFEFVEASTGTTADNGKFSEMLYKEDGSVYTDGDVLATYKFKAIGQTSENVSADFTISNTAAKTYFEAIEGIDLVTANNEKATVVINLIDYTVTAKLNNEEQASDSARLVWINGGYTFSVETDKENDSVSYTVNGNASNDLTFTDDGTYVIGYTVAPKAGYRKATGTFTLEIYLKEYSVETKVDGETAGTSKNVPYTNAGHTFEVVSTPNATVTYKVNGGEAQNSVSLTNKGTYTIEYTVAATDGYAEKTGRFTLTIEDPEYVVEVSETSDYVSGKKLVLVYTNTDGVCFNYNNNLMIDVTSREYKYNDTEEYTNVYAFVTDAITNGTLDDYKANISCVIPTSSQLITLTYLMDLNFDDALDVNDITTGFGIYNANETYFANVKYQKNILRADTDGSKKVDGTDTGAVVDAVKTARSNNG